MVCYKISDFFKLKWYDNFQRCLEYDTLEGNKYTMATTLHTCSGSDANWNNCDRAGVRVTLITQCRTLIVQRIDVPSILWDHSGLFILKMAAGWIQNSSKIETVLILIRVMTLYMYISEMDNQAFEGSVFTASHWGKNNF